MASTTSTTDTSPPSGDRAGRGSDPAVARTSRRDDPSSRSARIAGSGPDTVEVWPPGLGTIKLSRPELAYVGGIVGLSVLGFLDWPLALVVATGHVLAADRSSQTVADLGEAVEQA